MPWCDTDAMAGTSSSAAVDPGAHAVLIVAGRLALDAQLAIPDNITVLALPPRSPELKESGKCALVVEPPTKIVALCCQAWNNLIAWKIMSLGMRKWAHGF